MSRDQHALSPFGQQLRQWRRRSGVSQLDLALPGRDFAASRVVYRDRPLAAGRDLVLRLAAALDVPIRERNVLLTSAGLPPAFPARDLSDLAMRPVKLVLDRVLTGHEPFPAWIVGRGMQFLASNRAAEVLFPGLCSLQPQEIVDLWFGPGPFRGMVENWPDVVWAWRWPASVEKRHEPRTRNCLICCGAPRVTRV